VSAGPTDPRPSVCRGRSARRSRCGCALRPRRRPRSSTARDDDGPDADARSDHGDGRGARPPATTTARCDRRRCGRCRCRCRRRRHRRDRAVPRHATRCESAFERRFGGSRGGCARGHRAAQEARDANGRCRTEPRDRARVRRAASARRTSNVLGLGDPVREATAAGHDSTDNGSAAPERRRCDSRDHPRRTTLRLRSSSRARCASRGRGAEPIARAQRGSARAASRLRSHRTRGSRRGASPRSPPLHD